MSEKEKQKSQEAPSRKDAVDAAEEGRLKEKEGKKGKLDYVFKIVPADPKNSFDFEDVADK